MTETFQFPFVDLIAVEVVISSFPIRESPGNRRSPVPASLAARPGRSGPAARENSAADRRAGRSGRQAARHFCGELRHLFRARHAAAAAEAEHVGEAGHRPALGAAHRLHHVGHGAVHFQKPVDVLGLGAGAGGDAALAARLEHVGIAPLPRRHRIDDRHLPLEHLLVEIALGELVLHLGDAGQHRHQPAHAAHLLHLRELLAQVGEIERALAHLLGDARGLLGVDGRGGLLDQRDDVAHAEDAVGDARRIEILERVELFAGADQLDRLAGDRAHRQRGAAAAVAVDAGEHDAGEADALVEAAREIDRVLAGERVGDEQHFVRVGGAAHLGRLAHHRLVERDAAGGVEHHHVVAAEPRRLLRARRDLHRRLAGDDRQRLDADLPAEHGELLHGRRTARVERGHQHLALARVGEALGDLGGGGGFARALQADHHDGDRRRRIEIDRLARSSPASRSAGRARSSRPSGRA